MNVLNADQVYKMYQKLNSRRDYLVMYSSLLDGFVADAALMHVPVDDHLVHRGDGVFEAVRVTPAKLFLLNEHLSRLFRSAEMIGLKMPWSVEKLGNLCHEICRIGQRGPDLSRAKGEEASLQAMIRIFVGRGPGDFSPNPYATIGSQLYMVLTKYSPLPKEKYREGVAVGFSKIPAKAPNYARIKSCNYLPNVLMKKEAVDQGLDFVVGLTDDNFVAEGPTENIMIVTHAGDLVAPNFDYTLTGTTLVRTLSLAKDLKFNSIQNANLTMDDLVNAQEVMMVGTTLGVLPVHTINGVSLKNNGFAKAQMLNDLITQDMMN